MLTGCLVLVAACASSRTLEKGGPRGLRASDHLAAAERHERAANEGGTVATPLAPETGPVGMPWYRSWDTRADHERLAREHRSRAAALQAEFDEACRDISPILARESPLITHGIGSWPTSTGAIVYLDARATPQQLMTHLRCHRAWMMLAPAGDMDDCPIDLPGLLVDVRGEGAGITLSLSVRDRKLIPELQRRVSKQLETIRHEKGSL